MPVYFINGCKASGFAAWNTIQEWSQGQACPAESLEYGIAELEREGYLDCNGIALEQVSA